jgi:hypothetical protein
MDDISHRGTRPEHNGSIYDNIDLIDNRLNNSAHGSKTYVTHSQVQSPAVYGIYSMNL